MAQPLSPLEEVLRRLDGTTVTVAVQANTTGLDLVSTIVNNPRALHAFAEALRTHRRHNGPLGLD